MAVAVLVAGPLGLTSATPAQAAFAPGGSGLYKGSVDWLEWPASGANNTVLNGTQAVSTRVIAGQTLTTTCTIDNITGTGGVQPYKSGFYSGDSLDDLYNRGGSSTANTMVYGLANRQIAASVGFTFTCSATLGASGATNPANVSLGGLVVADAESSNKSQGEFVSAKPDSTSANWRIIERLRSPSCPTNAIASLSSDKTLKLSPDAEQCSSVLPGTGYGPMAIGYMEGATGATVSLKGGGTSAVALGVVLQADFGDAPASYGSAGALFEPKWSGGELSVGATNVSSTAFQLGTPGQPTTRLGALTDSDIDYQPSADADADDISPAGADDEDAIAPIGNLSVVPGQSYTLNNVACTGPGDVAGWLDWNANGTFDAGERSTQVSCSGKSVSLTWAVPPSGLPTVPATKTFLRLRIAKDQTEVASPTGLSTSGEVEDHALTLSVPTLSIQKNVTTRVASTDQFTLTLAQASQTLATATTSGTATGLQAEAIKAAAVTPGTVYTYSEKMAAGATTPLSEYDRNFTCTANYLDGTSTVLTSKTTDSSTATQTTGTITMPTIDPVKGAPAVVCVFGNSPKAATLTVNKTWIVNGTSYAEGGQPEGISAQLTLAGSTQSNPATTPSKQSWGATKQGYVAGQSVAIAESASIANTMPGCVVTNQRVSSANGVTRNIAIGTGPYNQTLSSGDNTVMLTNTVNCTTTLTLIKDVVPLTELTGNNASPSAWTLAAYPGTGSSGTSSPEAAPTVQGTTGVTANVTPGQRLQLAESNGSPLYVQTDSRTTAERAAAPQSTGSWVCTSAVTGQTAGQQVAGRMGADGTVTPTLGAHLSCAATNQTAELTLLKTVENPNGTGTASPSDFDLTATPDDGVTGLAAGTVTGSSVVAQGNTIQVRPGQSYLLTESGTTGGYLQRALQQFTGSDAHDAGQLANAGNWVDVDAESAVSVAAGERAVYRFVNRDVVRFALPLTGGSGIAGFVVGGGLVIALTVGSAYLVTRRRRTTARRTL